jgi:adenylate kinase
MQNNQKIILLGVPGSGKSTQGKLLSQKLRIPWISIGHLLREESCKNTKEGKIIYQYQSKGLNVPIDIKSKILEKALDRCKEGYVLDNYPRSKDDLAHIQKYFAERKEQVDKVILLKIKEEKAINRLLSKGQQAISGISRNDTSFETIKARIYEGFEKDADLVLSYFRKLGVLVEINGELSVEEVHKEIVSKI